MFHRKYIRRSTLNRLLALILTSLAATPVFSQGEHGRRVAAELLVLLGDAREFIARPAPSTQHQTGYQDRLRGGLAGLPLLIRLADQENDTPSKQAQQRVDQLRTSLANNKLDAFSASLAQLIEQYPLSTHNLLPAESTPSRLTNAARIHQKNCAACHEHPDLTVQRPAFNLFTRAQSISSLEFAARMIVGVRGDRMSGVENPLSDEQITAMIAYYQSNERDEHHVK